MKTKILIALSVILLFICYPFKVSAFAKEDGVPQLEVKSDTATAGTTMDVDISIKNNPGILGCKLTINYDSRLVLKSAQAGEAFSALTLTKPGVLENSCSFVWDGIELNSSDIKDGVILTLTFEVPADASDKDEFSVEAVCEDAVNKDLAAVSLGSGSGSISIEKKATVGELDKIEAEKTKKSYSVGDTLSVDDIAVTAVYTDGTKKSVTDFTTNSSSIDMNAVGKKTLVVTFTENGITKTADIEIDVKGIESVNNTKIEVSNNLSLPGDQIDVDISIKNNPGILGMTLTLQYDSKLKLISAKSGNAFEQLAMTKPGIFESGCKFVWDGTEIDEKTIKDGTILTLTFAISDEVKAGEKYIISASSEDAVDMNLNPVKIVSQSGSLSIGDNSSIVDNKLVGITATKKNLVYEIGSKLDLDDLVVVAEYNGGLYKNVDNYTTNISDINMNVVGEKILIITYSDQDITKTAEVKINVVDKKENHANHNKYSYVEEIPATCEKDGVKAYYVCDDCGRIFEDKYGKVELDSPVVIPKTGHSYKSIVVKATKTKDGSVVKRCSICNKETGKTVIYKSKSVVLSSTVFDYDGKLHKPTIVVKNSKGKTIAASNYDVIYDKGCKSVGKYKIKIVLKGNYSGTIERYYSIIPASAKVTKLENLTNGIKITWGKKAYDGYMIYRSDNGKTMKLVKTIKGSSVISWTDTKAIVNGYRYAYVVCPYKTVRGITYKSSQKAVKRTVYLASGKITTAGNPLSGKISVKWSKNNAATGYQVQYSKDKSFKSSVVKTYKTNKTVTALYANCKKGVTYYVRVRAYKKGTSTSYGAWSSVKKVKIVK